MSNHGCTPGTNITLYDNYILKRPSLIFLNLPSFIKHAKAKQRQVLEELWEAEGRPARLSALCWALRKQQVEYGGRY